MKRKFTNLYAKLIELPHRLVEFNKSLKVIVNGSDNDYPDRVAALIPNSITAKQCAKLFRQYLTGKGFKGLNEAIVNKKKKIKFLQFFNGLARQYSYYNGYAVHVQYKLNGKKDRVEILPFGSVRKGKKDDANYNGMLAYSKTGNFLKGTKKGDLVWCHAYNPDPEVVIKQIAKYDSIEKYPGQIFFFNPDEEEDYPLAHIHPVLNDADSEMRTSVFKNKSLRKGFFGKNILVMKPLVDPDLSSVAIENLKESEASNLLHQKNERDGFYESAKGFVGVENHEGLMIMELEHEGDIDKAFKHVEIPTNIDDKLFAYTESSVANNIRKAYNNAPWILLDSSVNKGVFGDSGKMLEAAKEFYHDQTEEDRLLLFASLKEVLSGLDGINFDASKFIPFVTKTPNPNPEE